MGCGVIRPCDASEVKRAVGDLAGYAHAVACFLTRDTSPTRLGFGEMGEPLGVISTNFWWSRL